MTNGDKIRQMSDFQLAELTVCGTICDICILKDCEVSEGAEYCVRNIEAWLKQEVSDERDPEI